MKIFAKIASTALGIAILVITPLAHAATPPNLGAADSFSILASTYTNTAPGTVINGDLGYTIPPVTAATVNGTTHAADATYNQAGIDQGVALGQLNSQPCTFTFAPGAVALASDTTHGPVGVYTPGVYCISGAAAIEGGGTITLSGTGTYIFRMTGALTSSANSIVAVGSGATACNVWWTPGAATTLGADSTFGGNIIDPSGITIGNQATITGRALAFGGTVTTDTDTINSTTCAATPPTTGTPTEPSGPNASSTPGLPNTGQSEPKGINYTKVAALAFGGTALLAAFAFHKRT